MAEIKNIKDYISKENTELNPISTIIASIGLSTAYKLSKKELSEMAKYYKIGGMTNIGTIIISVGLASRVFNVTYSISEIIRKGIVDTINNIKEVREENENGGSET